MYAQLAVIPALGETPDSWEAFVADVARDLGAAGPVELARQMVASFADARLTVIPEAGLFAHEERPVHWDRVGLDYTFILLTFRRR